MDQELDYIKIYSRWFPDISSLTPNDLNNVLVICPFPDHDDTEPSLSINIYTGLWKCFGCDSAGDIFTFIMKIENVDFRRAENIARSMSLPFIPPAEITRWKRALLKSTKWMLFLREQRGLTKSTINEYDLGWDGSRITIPVYDIDGNCVNIRRYSKTASGKNKVLNYKQGYGSPIRIFGLSVLKHDTIWVVEGELDCILANQLGLYAVTSTGGALAWNPDWADKFQDKTICICYDVDKSGKVGAERTARHLATTATEVKIIALPMVDQVGADVTDYIVANGATLEDFYTLSKQTTIWELPTVADNAESTDKDETVYEVHLSQATQARYFKKRVSVTGIVAGKTLAPYMVPKKVEFQCSADMDACINCPMIHAAGVAKTMVVSSKTKWLLDLIGVADNTQRNTLLAMVGAGRCKHLSMKVMSMQNVEEISVIPDLDFTTSTEEYCIRRCFFVGNGLRSNQPYVFTGLSLPDPKNQIATLLFNKADNTQGDIFSFKMTPEIFKQLRIFQPKKHQSITNKFKHIYTDLSANVTGIVGRHDLITAADLAWHSALSFIFQKRKVMRGWVEVLIIGDPRTGKTETVSNLQQHYRLGEFLTGENTSYAGLIGGLQQNNKVWQITWGKLPLNNGRLVAIDEISALSVEEIGQMSGVRSTGIAEITKIQTERTFARTRAIWMSNPRSARTLATYTYGVLAVKELIGRPEDIARFDLAMSVANNEVDVELINTENIPKVKHTYTSELCRTLLLWAWSRTHEQINFTSDAVSAILRAAIDMGNTYSPKIPFVEAADQRIKLARLATAAAIRTFSTEDGDTVLVTKDHVQFIVEYLTAVYSKPSFGYMQFSEMENQDDRALEQNKDEIETFLTEQREFAHLLMRTHQFRARELGEMLNVDGFEIQNYVSFLMKFGLLIRTPNGYIKSPALIQKLHEYLPHIPIENKPQKRTKSRF